MAVVSGHGNGCAGVDHADVDFCRATMTLPRWETRRQMVTGPAGWVAMRARRAPRSLFCSAGGTGQAMVRSTSPWRVLRSIVTPRRYARSRTVSNSATPQECKELPCGTSPEGIGPAVRNALRWAAQTLRHLDWFEMTQVRGQIVDGEIAHFQVGLKVEFRLEDG
jgi:flavin-binding protein dodecin